ncbi:WXG100 family type VII secretion target [Streptomyces sp. NPDC054765]
MTTYQVSLEQMSFVEGEMQTIARQIQQTLSELEASSKSSLAHWSSDARDAYNIAKAKWDEAAAAMQQQSAEAAKGLGTIGEYYNSGEKYGVNLWDQ